MPKKRFESDEELIRSLQKLRERDGEYPPELYKKQLSSYQKAVAGLTGFIPTGGFLKLIKRFIKRIGGGTLMLILLSAIVIVVGSSAFLDREQPKNGLTADKSPTNQANHLYQDTKGVEIVPSSTPEPTATGTLQIATSLPNSLIVPTATRTSTPGSLPEPTASRTVAPITTPTATGTNPGNHYGQTKTPKP